MGSHVYNKVSEELVEKFKKIVPGKVYTKDLLEEVLEKVSLIFQFGTLNFNMIFL